MVMGGDSCTEGCGFESKHHIDDNTLNRGRGGPLKTFKANISALLW